MLKLVNILPSDKNVHKAIKFSRYLPKDLRNIVVPVFERNGFIAQQEHLMLDMT